MKTLSIFVLGVLLFFVNCQKTKQTDHNNSAVNNKDSLAITTKQMPEWAIHVPLEDGYIYAVGQAQSTRPEIARRKAMLDARVKLAKKLSSKGDSLTILLQGSKIKQEKQIRTGKHWQSFVLMEVPVKNSNN